VTRPWGEKLPSQTLLRRDTEEKMSGSSAVLMKGLGNRRSQRFPAQAEKVSRDLFPGFGGGVYSTQINPPAQYRMSPTKPFQNNPEPAGYQPGGKQAIRIDLKRGAMETLLTLLPASQAQKQGPQDRTYRVLEIGDQLNGKQGEGLLMFFAKKPGYGNAFLFEFREKVNGIPPIGSNLAIAGLPSTNGTGGSDEGKKIDPSGKKRFLVFPNRFKCVKVDKLNLLAPGPQEEVDRWLKPFVLPLLPGLVILSRSIPYLVILPTFIPSVILFCKSSIRFLFNNVGDNTPFRGPQRRAIDAYGDTVVFEAV